MNLLAESEDGITSADIHDKLDIPKTTAFRIMKTLCHEDISTKVDNKYFLGSSLIHCGLKANLTNKLKTNSVPILSELSAATGFTAHICIPNGYHSLILDVHDSLNPFRVASRPGTKANLHCSSSGKIFLAHLLQDKLDEVEQEIGFVKKTIKTLTTIDALKEEIQKIVHRGYSVDDQEYDMNVRCLAAPLFDYNGHAVAAIGITAPSAVFTRNKIPEIAIIVKEHATKLYFANK
ncbi:IclR family transcriptional regulator [Thalassotalea sp. SU-HH00458]